MTKEQAIAICAPLFKTHSKTSELYVTTDGQAFFRELDATPHQRTLDKTNEPIKVTRAEAEAPAEAPKPKTRVELEAELAKANEKLNTVKTPAAKEKAQATIDAIQAELAQLPE